EGTRMRAGLVVESGDAREVAHVALLIGYGAGAVNPYLALDTVAHLVESGRVKGDVARAQSAYVHALEKGLLKTVSKMGISALSSYQGAQIFEAVGLGQVIVDRYFPGTSSRVRGIGLAEIAEDASIAPARAFVREEGREPGSIGGGGHYHFRRAGE